MKCQLKKSSSSNWRNTTNQKKKKTEGKWPKSGQLVIQQMRDVSTTVDYTHTNFLKFNLFERFHLENKKKAERLQKLTVGRTGPKVAAAATATQRDWSWKWPPHKQNKITNTCVVNSIVQKCRCAREEEKQRETSVTLSATRKLRMTDTSRCRTFCIDQSRSNQLKSER